MVISAFVDLDMEGLTVRCLSEKVSGNLSVCVVCSASAFSEVFKTDLISHIRIYHGVGGWGLGMGDGGVQ